MTGTEGLLSGVLAVDGCSRDEVAEHVGHDGAHLVENLASGAQNSGLVEESAEGCGPEGVLGLATELLGGAALALYWCLLESGHFWSVGYRVLALEWYDEGPGKMIFILTWRG